MKRGQFINEEPILKCLTFLSNNLEKLPIQELLRMPHPLVYLGYKRIYEIEKQIGRKIGHILSKYQDDQLNLKSLIPNWLLFYRSLKICDLLSTSEFYEQHLRKVLSYGEPSSPVLNSSYWLLRGPDSAQDSLLISQNAVQQKKGYIGHFSVLEALEDMGCEVTPEVKIRPFLVDYLITYHPRFGRFILEILGRGHFGVFGADVCRKTHYKRQSLKALGYSVCFVNREELFNISGILDKQKRIEMLDKAIENGFLNN